MEQEKATDLQLLLARSKSKALDHLPIVASALRRLRVGEIIDERIPPKDGQLVTTGESVEAMIASILMGSHTLYLVEETLEPYDCEFAFSWGDRVKHFNDKRLAKSLDQLFESGPQGLYAEFLASAIEAFGLSTKRLHTDTTSTVLHGNYWGSIEPVEPEDPEAVPHVTYGHSKDHRPDLKQILFGLTVTGDGAVPVAGRVASGNRADAKEFRYALRQIAEVVPDPQGSVVVMDSKGFSGETFLLFREQGVGYVTLMPRNVSIWRELVDRFEADDEQEAARHLLRVRLSPQDEDDPAPPREEARWEGRSYPCVYSFKPEGEEAQEVALRALVVESTDLRSQKAATQKRAVEKERTALGRRAKALEKKVFACEKDAEGSGRELVKRTRSFFEVSFAVRGEDRPKKRSKAGRPKKDEPRETERVWRVEVTLAEPTAEKLELLLRRASRFVIVGCGEHRLTKDLSDEEFFESYKDQDKVEKTMKWLKGPLRVAPIFLELPERIAGLGVVYVISLMVNALIQREIRLRLAELGEKMPGNRRWTDKPTTQVLFRLFGGIATVRNPHTDYVAVVNVNTQQLRVLGILGVDLKSFGRVVVAEPREPRPGERAWKPVPRAHKQAPPRKHGRKKSRDR